MLLEHPAATKMREQKHLADQEDMAKHLEYGTQREETASMLLNLGADAKELYQFYDGSAWADDATGTHERNYFRYIREKYEEKIEDIYHTITNPSLLQIAKAENGEWETTIMARCDLYHAMAEMYELERASGTEEGKLALNHQGTALKARMDACSDILLAEKWDTGLAMGVEQNVIYTLGMIKQRREASEGKQLFPLRVITHRNEQVKQAIYKAEEFERLTTEAEADDTRSPEEVFASLCERQQLWIEADKALDEVTYIDEYAALAYQMWVTDGKLPFWHPEVPWIKGFSDPLADNAVSARNWADEMDGIPAAGLIPCSRLQEHYNAMKKVLEYNKRGRPFEPSKASPADWSARTTTRW